MTCLPVCVAMLRIIEREPRHERGPVINCNNYSNQLSHLLSAIYVLKLARRSPASRLNSIALHMHGLCSAVCIQYQRACNDLLLNLFIQPEPVVMLLIIADLREISTKHEIKNILRTESTERHHDIGITASDSEEVGSDSEQRNRERIELGEGSGFLPEMF